jgi:uncharacterized delta-60 repeat protein
MWFLFSRKLQPARFGRPRRCSFRPRLEPLEDRYVPSGGVLDPTFGSGGLVSTTAGGLNELFAVATYPAGTVNAGEVVAVGDATVGNGRFTKNEPTIVRYNLNGALDTSFGGSGEVIMNLKSGGVARDMGIQPDGKIVVAYSSGSTFNLARFNANGTLDTSFGGSGTGIVSTSTGKGTTDTAYSLALEPNGDIVVAGTVGSSTGIKLALVRYTASGLLDTSFGPGGIVTQQFAAPLDLGFSGANFIDLALDTSTLDPNDGKIVVVTRLSATGHPDVVARYDADGSLDTSFAGGAGYETLSSNLVLMPSVAVQANGHIIVAGGNDESIELDRLNPDGSFDSTFGSGGIVAVSPPPNTVYYDGEDVTIQPDGKIVTAGPYQNTTTGAQDFFVARFNSADGALDTSFGTGGVATVASGSSISASTVSLALEPDGRIVVAGSLLTSTGGFALARFIAYGPEVGSFAASPNPVTAGSSLTLTAGNINDEIPSAAITQVAFYVNTNGTNALLGYGTQSSPGEWTLTLTVSLAPGTYTLNAQAEDNYGIIGDPNTLTLQVL